MNCVALSVYLALARVLTHKLGFLILDDPSQNLDTEHKVALARILKELQPATQLLIATQDSELQTILRSNLDSAGTLAYELDWHALSGTNLAPVW
jgi:DNA repair exonuclease SbcCD ATPase subunit